MLKNEHTLKVNDKILFKDNSFNFKDSYHVVRKVTNNGKKFRTYKALKGTLWFSVDEVRKLTPEEIKKFDSKD